MHELSRQNSDDDRKRRGTGIPWLPNPAPGGAIFGYSLSGIAASKLGLLGMIGILIGGTAVVGTRMGREIKYRDGLRSMLKRAAPDFRNVKTGAAAPGTLPGGDSGDANSLLMLYNANKGKAPGGSAAAGADAQGANPGDAAADPKTSDNKGEAAGNGQDPSRLANAAASASAGPAGAGGKRLAIKSFGSGASGGASGGGGSGAGMAAAPAANAEAARTEGIDAGKLQAFARPTAARTKTAAGGAGARRSGGIGNLDRLRQMNGMMRASTGMGNQQASAAQSAAWEARPAQGQSITGGGDGAGAPAGNNLDGPAANQGAPILSPTAPSNTPSSGGGQIAGQNVTPWQNPVTIATVLITIASILLSIAVAIKKFDWTAGLGAAKMLAYGALALSAIVTIIGVMLLAQGQMMQGGIFTAVGGLLAGLSYITANSMDSQSKSAEESAQAKAGEVKAADDAARAKAAAAEAARLKEADIKAQIF